MMERNHLIELAKPAERRDSIRYTGTETDDEFFLTGLLTATITPSGRVKWDRVSNIRRTSKIGFVL